jgi:hypothetical protein
MGLARPEGALLALFMLLAILHARAAGGSATTLRAFAVVFGGLGLAYFLWRWWYFGHPLPTPFYKKGGGVLHWDTFRKWGWPSRGRAGRRCSRSYPSSLSRPCGSCSPTKRTI